MNTVLTAFTNSAFDTAADAEVNQLQRSGTI
jgi:hypothetical protein